MTPSQIQLEDLINHLDIGIFRYSLDAKGRFWFANECLGRILGYAPKEILNMNFSDLCEDPEELNRVNTKICSEGYVKNEWIRLKKKTGGLMQCSLSASLVKDQNAKDLLVDGVIEDITEHKKAREGLLHAKLAAEAANTAKSMFLANMSHEVRTPMNAVIGMLDLTLETELNEDQKDNLLTAKEAADNLLNLLNDILDISRAEAGKINLERTDFNLWKMVESVIKGLSVLANKKNIQLNFSIQPKVPKFVLGDSTRIRQIIINLVNNAIKFTSEGNVDLKVDASVVSEQEIVLNFSISDTGIGIAQDKQEVIFDIFTQADDSTTRKFGGTGLGLAICKRLVSMMNGRIWIESQEGIGSTFFFTIKVGIGQGVDASSLPSVASQQASLGQETQAKGMRILHILLAEDNLLNQKIAIKLLEKKGWLVELAQNGQEAIDKINEKSFDLVLMDVQMPVLDGLKATQMIRQNQDQAVGQVPIIAMTAKAMVEDEQRCLDSGMDGYIAKPIDAAKLYATIEEVLKRKKLGQAL